MFIFYRQKKKANPMQGIRFCKNIADSGHSLPLLLCSLCICVACSHPPLLGDRPGPRHLSFSDVNSAAPRRQSFLLRHEQRGQSHVIARRLAASPDAPGVLLMRARRGLKLLSCLTVYLISSVSSAALLASQTISNMHGVGTQRCFPPEYNRSNPTQNPPF